MAKINIKYEKLTPFGGIFPIMEEFDRQLSSTIDSTLGLRCRLSGYQYSEILRSLMCVYFCGGSCVEDVTNHLMSHLSRHPALSTCSADTILRAIKELSTENVAYTSDSGKSYNFNTADKLNRLLVNALVATGQLKPGVEYDFDFDHQFIETEKYDAMPTYKKFTGYSPGVGVIGGMIVGIENRDGNANVRFHQQDTLERMFARLEDAVFLLLTALIHNFYKTVMQDKRMTKFGLKHTSRIKAFVFKLVSVPVKLIKTARRHALNIYAENTTYAEIFNTEFG